MILRAVVQSSLSGGQKHLNPPQLTAHIQIRQRDWR